MAKNDGPDARLLLGATGEIPDIASVGLVVAKATLLHCALAGGNSLQAPAFCF
jgi:hypothetical protein